MDSDGGFHEVENDGKLFLVYQNPKYDLIPYKQGSTSFGEAINDDQLLQPIFLCPHARYWSNCLSSSSLFSSPLFSSAEYIVSTGDVMYHSVLPLFWCNNKIFGVYGGCGICRGSNFGTDYYFCDLCKEIFHKECVQSPPKIKHPYHPEHHLQLHIRGWWSYGEYCLCCGGEVNHLVYRCTICEAFMHLICAMNPISFVINPPKRHDHPLTFFFPRQTVLTCNICGLLRKLYPTYICARCNFVAHNDCMNSPHIIKISRHSHRISYIYPLQSRESSCGVCRQITNSGYGAYTCGKCSNYVVHSRCALGNNVWDGEELEDIEEKDDIIQDFRPFRVISEGVIHYFLHDHHLQLKTIILYHESKLCQACCLPIYEGNFYSCMECHFIIHETCTNLSRRIQHALHPHPLRLVIEENIWVHFRCSACQRRCNGFNYECSLRGCCFYLDIRCASIFEPFDFKIHEHPLFLALDPKEKHICHVCKTKCYKQLNCIECNFIVCIKCATLPYTVRYTHDTYFLTFLSGEELCKKVWCDMCELNLGDTCTQVFYWSNEYYTAFHIECVIGTEPYMKPGQYYIERGRYKLEILGKNNISRPLCSVCKKHCQSTIIKRRNEITCSFECFWELERYD
ncbi:Protein VACUOLELESS GAMETOPHYTES [Cardamine amara subsp. amara]|uniref:Protein VACUOLELESS GAMETOPHYTES n=1 Tax=Cardamine amara subsp. amara TaxID=228776 RepID=A0ABD1B9V5_CARAN